MRSGVKSEQRGEEARSFRQARGTVSTNEQPRAPPGRHREQASGFLILRSGSSDLRSKHEADRNAGSYEHVESDEAALTVNLGTSFDHAACSNVEAVLSEFDVSRGPGWNSLIGGLIVTPNGRIVLNLRDAHDYVDGLSRSNARDEALRLLDLAANGRTSCQSARRACVAAIYGEDGCARSIADTPNQH